MLRSDEMGMESPDPVALLFERAKALFSAPLYIVQRVHGTGWACDAMRQWATGRRRPGASSLRDVADSLRLRAEAMVELAGELDAMAERMESGEVRARRRRRRGASQK